ncbi:MAG: GFA family protein [Methyloceanibacter sp.]
MIKTEHAHERTARCGCGKLAATAHGEPTEVYVCSCADCQRKSGSAFTYAAIYPKSAVTISGEHKSWRRHGDSGRFIESHFCPDCGGNVFFRAVEMSNWIGIAAGCFADQGFAGPARLFWASRRHHWLDLAQSITRLETQ